MAQVVAQVDLAVNFPLRRQLSETLLLCEPQIEGFDVDRKALQFGVQLLHVVGRRTLGQLEGEHEADVHRRVG